MIPANLLYSDLQKVKELLYDKCGFTLTNLQENRESAEYSACFFHLDGNKIEYRHSKITPTKTGQFVTIWKRDKKCKTAPFDFSDDFDFLIITSTDDKRIGQFIFPKSVLAEKGIISQGEKAGKRGIRVYSPWDVANSKQAQKTQSWQTDYFVEIKANETTDVNLIKKTFDKKK